MIRNKKIAPLVALGVALVPLAQANPIFYEVENLSGDTWQYTYTVGNETAAPIDQFTIFFDPDLYAFDLIAGPGGLQVDPAIYSGPAGWDLFVAPPDLLFPGPDDDQFGFFDGLALAAGVAPGELLSAFTIEFTWLGMGTPGSQPFTLFEEDLLDEFGDNLFTQPLFTPMSEPATVLLIGLGGLLLAARRRGSR
ncbi:MAG: PEP-CTERM sorting domain-containing protein [Gammaproteobacteria bacterium]|nr:PEP-CTERM sorting domain-containing protein [Gammaproteobacteria bacterium]NNF60474.1 PEP-CTERM sorting domain-containing protein [Gammaproteobacteria bacterium]